MKKLITSTFLALFFSISAFAVGEFTISNKTIRTFPMKITSIAVINPLGNEGYSETVSLSNIIDCAYSVERSHIVDGIPTTTNAVNCTPNYIYLSLYSIKSAMGLTVLSEDTVKIAKINNDDLYSYSGVIENTRAYKQQGDAIVCNVYVVLYTDYDSNNVIIDLKAISVEDQEIIGSKTYEVSNILSYQNLLSYFANGNWGPKLYDLDGNPKSVLGTWYTDPDYDTTAHVVDTFNFPKTFKKDVNILNFDVGTSVYSSTNTQIYIPKNSRIKASFNQDNTSVKIFYE